MVEKGKAVDYYQSESEKKQAIANLRGEVNSFKVELDLLKKRVAEIEQEIPLCKCKPPVPVSVGKGKVLCGKCKKLLERA